MQRTLLRDYALANEEMQMISDLVVSLGIAGNTFILYKSVVAQL